MLKLYYGGKQHYFGCYATEEKAVSAKSIVQGIMNDEVCLKSSCRKEIGRMVELARNAACDAVKKNESCPKEIGRMVESARNATYNVMNKNNSHTLVATRRSTRLKSSNVVYDETTTTEESTLSKDISIEFSKRTKATIQQWADDTVEQILDKFMHDPKIP